MGISLCSIWRRGMLVSCGLKFFVLPLSLPRSILDNHVNFWSWCLPLLQSKLPHWDFALLQLFCLSVWRTRMSFEILTWGNCCCLLPHIQYSHLDSIQLSLQLFFCCLVWVGKNSWRREEPSVVDQSNWSQANKHDDRYS